MAARVQMDFGDLTRSALERICKQLAIANEEEEKKILRRLARPSKAEKESNDLADLTEEKRGSPSKIDPMDDDDDEEEEEES